MLNRFLSLFGLRIISKLDTLRYEREVENHKRQYITARTQCNENAAKLMNIRQLQEKANKLSIIFVNPCKNCASSPADKRMGCECASKAISEVLLADT